MTKEEKVKLGYELFYDELSSDYGEVFLNEPDIDNKVEQIVKKALSIYFIKLQSNKISLGLEASFQHNLAIILMKLFNLNCSSKNEHFSVNLEENFIINSKNDYVDIDVRYENGVDVRDYLIELKYKKITDSAPDLGNIESYKDIYNLDQQVNQHKVRNGYFIFLTDYQTYTTERKKGTREELPMYDGYTITNNHTYNVSGKAAKDAMKEYPMGFSFVKNYHVEYKKLDINNKPYWLFMLKM